MSRWDPAADEVRNPEPYDYAGAKAAHARGSRDQQEAEKWLANSAKDAAEAEQAYRLALAKKITELRAEYPATVCLDMAKGDPHVAELRMKRDIKEGVKEAAAQAGWRASANRRGLEQLVEWSMRVAPLGQHEAPQ